MKPLLIIALVAVATLAVDAVSEWPGYPSARDCEAVGMKLGMVNINQGNVGPVYVVECVPKP